MFELIENVWSWVSSKLWSGEVDRIMIFCGDVSYSTCLDMAQDLRKDFEVEVSVKMAETITLDDQDYNTDEGRIFVLTTMTPSLFKDGYFQIACFKGEWKESE